MINSNNFIFFYFIENEIPKNTFYDKENEIYRNCYEVCGTCDKYKDDLSMNCNSCIEKYHFINISSMKNNCINEEEKENNYSNYYLDEELNIYKKCHENCEKCSFGGINDIDEKCDKCIEGKYFKKSEPQLYNCYFPSQIPQNYYLDINDNMFKYCYDNCQSCNKGYNPYTKEEHCTKCNYNLYFKEEEYLNKNEGNCYNKNQLPSNYYFDKNDNYFKLCYLNCKSCSEGGTKEKNNCDYYCFIH